MGGYEKVTNFLSFLARPVVIVNAAGLSYGASCTNKNRFIMLTNQLNTEFTAASLFSQLILQVALLSQRGRAMFRVCQ